MSFTVAIVNNVEGPGNLFEQIYGTIDGHRYSIGSMYIFLHPVLENGLQICLAFWSHRCSKYARSFDIVSRLIVVAVEWPTKWMPQFQHTTSRQTGFVRSYRQLVLMFNDTYCSHAILLWWSTKPFYPYISWLLYWHWGGNHGSIMPQCLAQQSHTKL